MEESARWISGAARTVAVEARAVEGTKEGELDELLGEVGILCARARKWMNGQYEQVFDDEGEVVEEEEEEESSESE